MKKELWAVWMSAALCLSLGGGETLAVMPEVVERPALPATEPFGDVTFGQRWYDGAQYGYRKGFVQGVTETQFGGELPATRAMAAAMLWRLAGEPEPLEGDGFFDVEPGWYYAPAAAWGEETGLWQGYEDGTFRPHETVTWGQLETVLGRYLGRVEAFQTWTPGLEAETRPVTRGELAEALMELEEKR